MILKNLLCVPKARSQYPEEILRYTKAALGRGAAGLEPSGGRKRENVNSKENLWDDIREKVFYLRRRTVEWMS